LKEKEGICGIKNCGGLFDGKYLKQEKKNSNDETL